jgi:hypothetical protein
LRGFGRIGRQQLFQVLIDEAGVEPAGAEVRMLDDRA